MNIDIATTRKCLKSFDFQTLFREQLGWDNHQAKLDIPIDGKWFQLTAIAQKRGFVVFTCPSIPDRPTRLKIDHQITKSAREHFVIYVDQSSGQQVWQWVRREPGKPLASRDYRFDITQSGDPLIHRLNQIAVSLDEEEKITVVDVAGRARAAFDVDKVTKKFYDCFKTEHAAFLKLIKGIKADADLQWYTSLMLNRLMFVYFIQKKGFLDGDLDYLRNRLTLVKQAKGKDKFQSFYRYFLVRLFHDGLGKSPEDRKLDAVMEKLLGKVPYLNGGFFEVHQLEEHNPDIDIPDEAFEKLFDFFEFADKANGIRWNWHLDERPLRTDNEINPDVVGYIFEKYINQKQMGAYYTKEDITEYISKNTIIPFLFDAAQKKCAIAFQPDSALWRLLRDDPDRYIYPAVRHGVVDVKGNVIPLPTEIEVGVKDVAKRDDWNKTAAEPFGLPTETWREHVARRQRCLDIRAKLSKGDVGSFGAGGINDLITLNLDIWQFARDAIVNAEGPELLRAFWHAIEKVTVLDPTCGSGAFLFAALRILQTLYSDCLERMERFVEDADHAAVVSPEDQVRALIAAGEGGTVEYKSSARWDIKENKHNPVMEDVIVKTVAGFLNGHGGTLLIGVDDSGKVIGLKNDYQYTKKQNPNRDQFELWLNQYLVNMLGKFVRPFFHLDFACLDGEDVCRLIVHRSSKPVFVKKNDHEILYARQGNATVPYTKASEILEYKEQHWPADQPVHNPPPQASPYAVPAVKPSTTAKSIYSDFRQTLALLAKHPSPEYFALKSIIINNLFGVDIMEEAVEICKLRLFLKLVAQVETVSQIEPLPDIDFNIRAGNTLVGYATLDQVRKSQEGKLGFTDKLVKRIEEDAEMVEKAFRQFRAQQTTHGGKVTRKDKQELRTRLAKLDTELDRYLAGEYGVNVDKQKAFDDWKTSHEPFHWFVEFFGIMSGGGFDVIVGNPPYVEYKDVSNQYTVRGFATEDCKNLFAYVLERSSRLTPNGSRIGMIVPLSAFSTDRMIPLIAEIRTTASACHVSNFSWRPGKLFDGVNLQLSIAMLQRGSTPTSLYSTRYILWDSVARPELFSKVEYCQVTDTRLPGSVPKLGLAEAASILAKLRAQKSELGDCIDRRNSNVVYYRRGGLYWKVFVDFETGSSEEKRLPLRADVDKYAVIAALSSNLWFWYFTATSDCRHLGNRDIDTFPFNPDRLKQEDKRRLADLGRAYVKDLRKNADTKVRVYKGKKAVECMSFVVKRSKELIDAIDLLIGTCCCFTADELDFVRTYDIKYRLGDDDDCD